MKLQQLWHKSTIGFAGQLRKHQTALFEIAAAPESEEKPLDLPQILPEDDTILAGTVMKREEYDSIGPVLYLFTKINDQYTLAAIEEKYAKANPKRPNPKAKAPFRIGQKVICLQKIILLATPSKLHLWKQNFVELEERILGWLKHK